MAKNTKFAELSLQDAVAKQQELSKELVKGRLTFGEGVTYEGGLQAVQRDMKALNRHIQVARQKQGEQK